MKNTTTTATLTGAKRIDLLISPRWIIPVRPKGVTLENHSIAIHKGNIVAIAPSAEAEAYYQPRQHKQLPEHVVIPGLINAHTHAAMSLLRGFADDLPLQQWLEKHIWPTEALWVSEQFVEDGVELAMAEMIRSGTSCFADMYFFPDVTAKAVDRAGMRCQLAFPILDHPTCWASDIDEYLSKGLALRDSFKQHPLINAIFGPHSPYTLSDNSLEKVANYAMELDTGVHIHLHETAVEISDSLKQHGIRPIERLKRVGLISPLLQCAHMVHLNEEDMAHIKHHNASVIHCPSSNLKLASGFSPICALLDQHTTVALGSDGAASNNSLDMFAELRFAALLAKVVGNDAAALDAHSALEMATINGAKALGWADRIGSIEVGKAADLCAVSLDSIAMQPMYNAASQLVYTTQTSAVVTHLWVNGVLLMNERQLQTLDEPAILNKTKRWQQQLLGTA